MAIIIMPRVMCSRNLESKSQVKLALAIALFSILCLSNTAQATMSFPEYLSKEPCDDTLFSDMLKPFNYPFQSYNVTTDDGYILRVFRMQARNTKITSGKKVVFLQHGLFDSADGWVVNEQSKSLGFALADAGYDVWLGNNRGNKYSRANKRVSPSNPAFWNYSFQEMGMYDVKAQLTFVLNFAGVSNLVYVGHSQGTSQMFAALSDPATQAFVNSKVSVFIALAPITYVANANSYLIRVLASDSFLLETLKLFNIDEILPGACSKTSAQSEFEAYVCLKDPELCEALLVGFGDYDPTYDNEARLPIFAQHVPSGVSLRCLLHYRQLYESDPHNPKFTRFDFGKKGNEQAYGQATPPPYDFSLINIPVRAFVGNQDELADPTDVTKLVNKMNTLGRNYKQYTYDQWGHITFLWGKTPAPVFNDILTEIKNFA